MSVRRNVTPHITISYTSISYQQMKMAVSQTFKTVQCFWMLRNEKVVYF